MSEWTNTRTQSPELWQIVWIFQNAEPPVVLATFRGHFDGIPTFNIDGRLDAGHRGWKPIEVPAPPV